MNLHALVVALIFALTFGEAHAFDAAEQQTINDLQQQIVLLQTQLAQLTGSALTPEDVATLAWAVVAALAVGYGVKLIKEHL